MNEIQNTTDVEKARERLEQAQALRDAQRDGRDERTAVLPATHTGVKKDIRPVTAKPKKKKFGQKMKEAMFGEDVGNVSEYVFFKIFIPSVKRILSDMANTAINMALGLDPKTRTVGGNTHTANASLYRDRNYNRGDSYRRRSAVSEAEWDEETAKDIFNQMAELIERYGNCSIADAYSIMGMGDQIRTTDRNWGWTTMRNADVIPVDRAGDRWIVDMPDARPLN